MFGLRAGDPSIEQAIHKLESGVEELVVVPMYPQYSKTTSGAILCEVFRAVGDLGLLGAYIGTDFGTDFDDERLDPFWATAVELDVRQRSVPGGHMTPVAYERVAPNVPCGHVAPPGVARLGSGPVPPGDPESKV